MLIPRLIVVAEVVALIQVTQFYFGDTSVVEKDGGLSDRWGPKNDTFPMHHYDPRHVHLRNWGRERYWQSGVTFTIAPDGEASQVIVENLNVHGEGIFKHAQK